MDISATLTADLAALTAALDQPDIDLDTQLQAFTANAQHAVTSYLGMTMTIAVNGYEVSFTAREDTASARSEIATSLLIPLTAVATTLAGSTLLLYAATSGAFVDLAADLSYALNLDHTDLVIDDHPTAPPNESRPGVTDVDGHRAINQAIGALIQRGHTPDSARVEVQRIASLGGGNLHRAAEQVLHCICGDPPGDSSSPSHAEHDLRQDVPNGPATRVKTSGS